MPKWRTNEEYYTKQSTRNASEALELNIELHATVSLLIFNTRTIRRLIMTISIPKSLSFAIYFQNSSLHSFLFIVLIRIKFTHITTRKITWMPKWNNSMCMCVRACSKTNNSRANSTSPNYVRPPKKGNLTPDDHPKATTIQAGTTAEPAGVENESTAAENENATDASIEITTSTAIINGSPQSPPPPQSPSELQQQHSGTSNDNQAQATGSTDLTDSSNSNHATAGASTSSAKPQYRTRAKTDHTKYGFDVVWIAFIYFCFVVCVQATWLHCEFPLFPHIHLFAKRVAFYCSGKA